MAGTHGYILQDDTDNQTISLSGNVITLSNGLVPDTTVDLSSFLDNTDDQIISATLTGTDLVLGIEDGNTVVVPLASINTDDQTLILAGSSLSIEDGNTVDLTPFLDNTDDQVITAFNLAGDILTLTIENGNTVTVDLSQYADNTDDQILDLVGNTLNIENGNSVDLSVYLDNTDNQILSLVGNALNLTSDDGTDIVDLSAYLDNTDAQILSGNLVGTNLVLSISNGNTITIPLSSIDTDTDDQILTLVGNTLSIEDGNSVNLSAYLDNTDEQVLSTTTNPVTGATNSITISNGNTVPIVHPGLLINVQPIYHENYAAGTNTASQIWNRNLILSRTGVGSWTATFVGAHPDGDAYHITATAEEQSGVRDTPDITIVQGSKTAAGFELQITTGDNGGAADTYVDTPFTVSVNSPVNVVTSVSQN